MKKGIQSPDMDLAEVFDDIETDRIINKNALKFVTPDQCASDEDNPENLFLEKEAAGFPEEEEEIFEITCPGPTLDHMFTDNKRYHIYPRIISPTEAKILKTKIRTSLQNTNFSSLIPNKQLKLFANPSIISAMEEFEHLPKNIGIGKLKALAYSHHK